MTFIRDLLQRIGLGDDEEEDDDSGLDYRGATYEASFLASMKYQPEKARMPPRPYQKEAVSEVLDALAPGKPQILHLATGGGKTWVANDIAVRWLERHRGPVLWVTKDWRLLAQAVTDLGQRHQGMRVARLGGDGAQLHPLDPLGSGQRARFVYSTVQTITRRLADGVLSDPKPCLLVWDECHWGEHGGAGKILTACKRRRIPVLGLTATPREVSRYRHAYSKTFHDLVREGVLAKPEVEEPVKTNVRWSPQRASRFSDISQASLRELAEHSGRNKLIVQHYSENVARYGKTIVFACGIGHVDRLTDLFSRSRGIAASALHSRLPDSDKHRALDDFRSGAVQVLVNADMLTHGIDIPDAQTIFLCRPTTSDILFAQMVGRGARRAPGKKHFNIVEFTDNVTEHSDVLYTPKHFFSGSGPVGATPGPSPARRVERAPPYTFDPAGAPVWIPDDPRWPESLRGLWYRQKQTFGVEIELTPQSGDVPLLGDEWRKTAEELRRSLAAVLPRVAPQVISGYEGSEGDKDHTVWNVEYDRSAGWEVTSRVLREQDGFVEVDAACRALEVAAARLGLGVNHRTGTHIHIGWLGRDVAQVKRAIQLARLFEPALASLVAPSRVAGFDPKTGRYDISSPNIYCAPISTVFRRQEIDRIRSLDDIRQLAEAEGARYVTFNLRPLPNIHTVEVRLHNGTLEARKILLWVSLWQQILWAAASDRSIPDTPDIEVIRPTGDIVQLAQIYLPEARQPQQQALLQRLETRRKEIRELWRRSPELAPWLN